MLVVALVIALVIVALILMYWWTSRRSSFVGVDTRRVELMTGIGGAADQLYKALVGAKSMPSFDEIRRKFPFIDAVEYINLHELVRTGRLTRVNVSKVFL